jgi:hypothetical protein
MKNFYFRRNPRCSCITTMPMKNIVRQLILWLAVIFATTGFGDSKLGTITLEPDVVALGRPISIAGSFSCSSEVGSVGVLSSRQSEFFRQKVKLAAGLEKTATGTYSFSVNLPTKPKQGDPALPGKHTLRLLILDLEGNKIDLLDIATVEVHVEL